MKLFEKQPINTGRQVEADYAKTVCIIGMVIVHAFEELAYCFPAAGTEESAFSYIVVVVLDALFGAATFMFCMGFGIAYSPKNDPGSLIRRGAKLFLMGYLLNFLHDVLPDILNALIIGDSTLLEEEGMILFLFNDILQFAGLALILFGLLKKWKLSDIALAAVALGMSLLASFVRQFDLAALLSVRNDILYMLINQFGGLFFGVVYRFDMSMETNCFPLFHWFVFVVAGYLFAKALRRCTCKGRFYGIFSSCSIAIVTVYAAFTIPNQIGMMSDDLNLFYHMTTPEALVCCCAAVSALGMYYALSRLLPQAVSNFAVRISRNLTTIYIIHWILIGFTVMGIWTLEQLKGNDPSELMVGTGLTFAYALVILVSAIGLTELIKKRRKKEVVTKC